MHLYTILPTSSEPSFFVSFWMRYYDFGNEETYYSIIKKDQLQANDIERLFQWKNNMGKNRDAMSGGKKTFVEKVITRLPVINRLKKDFDIEHYKKSFNDLSAIWGITLLHVVSSGVYPIYDQHVHRAYKFIVEGKPDILVFSNKERYRVYFEEYVPFFNTFKHHVHTQTSKEIDSALWAFGRYLSRFPFKN
jgi:hypothetical protein